MQLGVLTVGTTAVQVPITQPYDFLFGMRLLARAANSGNVYMGLSRSVTTSTGVLVSQGAPASSNPTTLPAEFITQLTASM
jgi:hypothetical protein